MIGNVVRARCALAVFFLVAHVLFDVGGFGFAGAVALAATATVGAALIACALSSGRTAPAVPRTKVRTAIRDRERRTAFLAQRDPDAAGRPRPRAPGRLSPTAA
ncbi:DUF6412 domain-containing protein [Streptomyces candidus]|uniref:Uncharacterized protein n=1 Tax=Streptomyces candidus TaxID=67283 RepID=A0A7X0LQD9_9ACTN|nr:hypothetical protein [Streptomyces candidus]GHH32356.1 hypothetical protein GCM10018773_01290 [Streptomyces candidus]